MRIIDKPSPNNSPRNGTEVQAVVIHYDASLSDFGAVSWMRNPQSRVSAHFHIGRDGNITQLVDLGRAAWHAGVATLPLPDGTSLPTGANEHSIGVEIANAGMLQRDEQGMIWYRDGDSAIRVTGEIVHAAMIWPSGMRIEGWWAPYLPVQIDALAGLLDWLPAQGYAGAVANLVGHDEIAKPDGRKQDPGICMPWGRFKRACQRAITVERLP